MINIYLETDDVEVCFALVEQQKVHPEEKIRLIVGDSGVNLYFNEFKLSNSGDMLGLKHHYHAMIECYLKTGKEE